MGNDVFEFVYLCCFFVGLGFAILSALMSGVFSGGAEAHVDSVGGHVDAPGMAHDGPVHFSPLSPVTLAMFIATFGGTGILMKKLLNLPPIVHVPVAGVSGIVVGLAVSWFFYKVMVKTQSSSHARTEEAIGAEAEVTVPIPHEGLGEIAYTLRGTRLTNPARTADGKELPARTSVKVVKQVGNTFIVQKLQ
mgnify:CR=1 FL=1